MSICTSLVVGFYTFGPFLAYCFMYKIHASSLMSLILCSVGLYEN